MDNYGYSESTSYVDDSSSCSSSRVRRRKTPHFDYRMGERIWEYKIVAKIDDGTFGRCLMAEDKKRGKMVALKVS